MATITCEAMYTVLDNANRALRRMQRSRETDRKTASGDPANTDAANAQLRLNTLGEVEQMEHFVDLTPEEIIRISAEGSKIEQMAIACHCGGFLVAQAAKMLI